MKIFLSYARIDGQQLASRLYNDLKEHGLEPWMDQRGGITAGERFDEKIQIALDQSDVFVILLTPGSVRPGGFCRQELTYALQNGKTIIPLMAIDCAPPIQITTFNWLDLRYDYNDAFTILLDALLRNDLNITSLSNPVSTNLGNYRIEGNDVVVFYQQDEFFTQIGPHRVAPRIAGSGGYLFGRAAVFEECVGILHSQLYETIILHGMGGIGKSSLAAGLAWGLAKYFAGGTIWLNAENATLIDLCDMIGRVYEDEQMARLPEKERPLHASKLLNREKTLVVLDNINSRETVQGFQEECRPANLIVTTRNRFALLGQLVELTVLANEPASALFRAVSRLDATYNQDIYKLVQMLGGHPQALAIAAALCLEEKLTPAELVEMLNPAIKRIVLLHLQSGTRNNVWATFDTSYQTLTNNEKKVFCTLGGTWSRNTTESMLSLVTDIKGEDLASALRGLVRRALISSKITHNIRVYTLHDLIHAYAQALVQQQDGNLLPMQTHWLTGAVAYAQLHAYEDNTTHYNYLEVELGNLLGAADWAIEQKRWMEADQVALSLCARSDMMSKRGYSRESVHLLEQGILASQELRIPNHEMLHLGMLGSTYIDLSSFSKAIDLLKGAVEISEGLGDQSSTCKWTGMIGNAYGDMGISDKAIEYLNNAVDLARALNDKVMEGFWLGWRGNAYRDMEQYDLAKENLLEAITVLEAVNHTLGITMWRGNYARTLARSGNPATGLLYCKDNPAIADQLGNPRLKSWALLFRSECLRGVGLSAEAYSDALEGAELMRKIADLDGLAEILHNLGAWYLQDNNLENANFYLKEAQALRKSMSHGDLPKTEALLKELEAKQQKLARPHRQRRKGTKKIE